MKKYIHIIPILLLVTAIGSCNKKIAVNKLEETLQVAETPAESLTKYVNPFMGTANHGHVYPGATVPFGMVQLSPDNGTQGWDWCSGYNWESDTIVGFSHTHLSGTGIGDLYDISMMPTQKVIDFSKKLSPKQNVYAAKFSHQNEKASPGFYEVALDNGIKVQLTATERVGFHQYSFPKGKAATMLLDLGFSINWDKTTDTHIKYDSEKKQITGYRFSTGWAKDQRVYFAASFSEPITSYQIADSTAILPKTNTYNGQLLRTQLNFGKIKNLKIKVGISTANEAGAIAALQEIPDWDFEKVKKEADQKWEQELSKIKIETLNEDLKTIFYTSLYRTCLAPVLLEDANGNYKGAGGEIQQSEGYNRYGLFSLWDTFRAAHPLYTITQKDKINDFINSMLAHYEEYGLLPVWDLLANETNTMTGYHAIPVIADAYLKCFRDYDVEKAFEAMKASAMQNIRATDLYREYGYIPYDKAGQSVTRTLEYAYDDWCIAQMAKALGKNADYENFSKRAKSYEPLFDDSSGFMRAKNADKSWKTPFDPQFSDHNFDVAEYTEGNAWQHAWFTPQAPNELIQLHGGPQNFIKKLDSLFVVDSTIEGENASPDISGLIGQYAHGNEPSHHIAYFYNFAGQPHKTQAIVRKIMDTQYNAGPTGLCGNEDCGQMSAWYVFSAMGFYPFNPADGKYQLGSPLFDKVEIPLGDGKTFTVIANNASKENKYIQSVKWNGATDTRYYITHDDLMSGGTLEIEMGADPIIPSEEEIFAKEKQAMAASVKAEFLHAWNGYKKYAWGMDALKPLSKKGANWYKHSLLMTPVDAFDTMLLMELEEEAKACKQLILDSLSFDYDMEVQIFEIVIRILGGLISAYQMDGDPKFLSLATDLGNRLLPAFDTPTGMPYRMVNLKTGAARDHLNNPAEIGTLQLEFAVLSKLTGDEKYRKKVDKAIEVLYSKRSPKTNLVGTIINVKTGAWENTDSHISGMIDSYYEYLLKMALLFDDEQYQEKYDVGIAAVNQYLLDKTPNGWWYSHVNMDSGEKIRSQFGALDAFMPAMLAMGGDLETAKQVQESCFKMWTDHKIEPEQYDYVKGEILAGVYFLRPENIESAAYLFHHTGDKKYFDMGKTMFESIVKYCKTDIGYAELKDVRTMEQQDDMQSFFLAETLKYAYLLFSDQEILDFKNTIFNTEAHPMQRTW